MRPDGRKPDQIRDIRVVRPYQKYAEGSVLLEMGDTRVVCSVSVEERVPPWLKGTGQGWITAEYGMLPRSTQSRINRETVVRTTGRTYEIQRLIGRAMRAVVDTTALGERTYYVDCDVIQADGGTRTAAINGSFIAMVDALRNMKEQKRLRKIPVEDYLAAVSIGIVDRQTLMDLCYLEDSQADVDMTLVMTGNGRLVEVQAGGEGTTFSQDDLNLLISQGAKGIKKIVKWQKELLGELK
ncbi:MAG: ribonuclease PH [bacterium]|nr:MAG: ribonuclease PH [bacterium]